MPHPASNIDDSTQGESLGFRVSGNSALSTDQRNTPFIARDNGNGVRCVTAAFCVFFLSVHDDKLYELFNSSVPAVLQIAVGEVKECLIAMFILVYIVDFSQRDFERHNPSDSAPADT